MSSTYYTNFVDAIVKRKDDKKFLASLKRADNDNLFFYSQPFIDTFVNTENKESYIAFAVIAANLASNINKYISKNTLSLGEAFAKLAYDNDTVNNSYLTKLYKLFTITDRITWCEYIGKLIRFIEAQLNDYSIDYISTLEILNKRDQRAASLNIVNDFFNRQFIQDNNFDRANDFFNYLKTNSYDRALMANLRRAISNDSNFYAFSCLASFVPRFNSIDYDVYALIAYFFKDLHDDKGCSLGEVLYKVSYDKKTKTYSSTSLSYLKKIIASKTRKELCDQMFYVLSYLKNKKTSRINLLKIVDFFKLGCFEKQKKQLIREFYQQRADKSYE